MDFKELRKSLGITQKKAAELLQVSTKTIEAWEGGWRTPPPYAQDLLQKRMEDLQMDLIIKKRYNEDFCVDEYDCGKGWRTSLLGAMEEAGHKIEMCTLSSYLQGAAIVRGLDEYKAQEISELVEDFFGVLEVPKDLNRGHYIKKKPHENM